MNYRGPGAHVRKPATRPAAISHAECPRKAQMVDEILERECHGDVLNVYSRIVEACEQRRKESNEKIRQMMEREAAFNKRADEETFNGA